MLLVFESRRNLQTYELYLLVVAGKVGGAPAVYGCSDVLSRGDKHSTDDEEQHGIAVMQPIDQVVVITRVELEDALDG